MQTNPSRQTVSRRQFLQVTVGASALLALSACAPPAPPAASAPSAASAASAAAEPRRGGVLRMIIADDVTSLDPNIFYSYADIQLASALYNNLVRRAEGEAGTPIYPELAESWEMNEDATVWTFHLRQGVVFSHGTPFTAKDVEYTINRLLDPGIGTNVAATLGAVERLEIVDDYTIRIHLAEPNVALPDALGATGVGIGPHDRTTEQLATEAAGTGPFVLAERVPGERTVLKRNENYWDPQRPYLDEVHLLPISEPTTQIAALTSGTADMIYSVGLENLSVLESATGVAVVERLIGIYPVYAMQVTEKPFDDVRVRQAFKHAIDRDALHAALLQGRGFVGNDQPIAPGSPFSADLPPLAYDVEKAKQLLADAGYPDGLEVTLSTSDIGGPRLTDAAIAMQEMVKAAGITLNVDKIPVGTYWTESYRQTPFFVSFWPVFADPNGVLPSAFTAQGGFNEGGWSDPKVDALIVSARGELDMVKRKQLYAEVQQIISTEGAVLIPFFAPFVQAIRTNVRGHIPEERTVFQDIWLAGG